MAKDYLKQLTGVAGNPYAFRLDEEDNPYKVTGFIDTGCYFLNAVLGNGDIFGGFMFGKRNCFAGKHSTAKSFLGAHLVRAFLEQNENSYVAFFESEGASINEMCEALQIPKDRIIIFPVSTVEDFREQAVNLLDEIIKIKEKEGDKAPKFMMVLDSLGMLGTHKEYEDVKKQTGKADMTRGRIIKSIFRLITLKLSLAHVPFLIVSHAYDSMDLFSRVIAAGGSGTNFASDNIFILSKAKQKEGTEQVGAIITLTVDKSRFITEGKKIKFSLLFKKGLDKYSYLLEFAEEVGLLSKVEIDKDELKAMTPAERKEAKASMKKVVFNGKQYDMDEILSNKEAFFTPENLEVFRVEIKKWLTFDSETDVDEADILVEDAGEENESE